MENGLLLKIEEEEEAFAKIFWTSLVFFIDGLMGGPSQNTILGTKIQLRHAVKFNHYFSIIVAFFLPVWVCHCVLKLNNNRTTFLIQFVLKFITAIKLGSEFLQTEISK